VSCILLGGDIAAAELFICIACATGFDPDIRRSLVRVRTRIRRGPKQPSRADKA
jgi:hypothetical protein